MKTPISLVFLFGAFIHRTECEPVKITVNEHFNGNIRTPLLEQKTQNQPHLIANIVHQGANFFFNPQLLLSPDYVTSRIEAVIASLKEKNNTKMENSITTQPALITQPEAISEIIEIVELPNPLPGHINVPVEELELPLHDEDIVNHENTVVNCSLPSIIPYSPELPPLSPTVLTGPIIIEQQPTYVTLEPVLSDIHVSEATVLGDKITEPCSGVPEVEVPEAPKLPPLTPAVIPGPIIIEEKPADVTVEPVLPDIEVSEATLLDDKITEPCSGVPEVEVPEAPELPPLSPIVISGPIIIEEKPADVTVEPILSDIEVSEAIVLDDKITEQCSGVPEVEVPEAPELPPLSPVVIPGPIIIEEKPADVTVEPVLSDIEVSEATVLHDKITEPCSGVAEVEIPEAPELPPFSPVFITSPIIIEEIPADVTGEPVLPDLEVSEPTVLDDKITEPCSGVPEVEVPEAPELPPLSPVVIPGPIIIEEKPTDVTIESVLSGIEVSEATVLDNKVTESCHGVLEVEVPKAPELTPFSLVDVTFIEPVLPEIQFPEAPVSVDETIESFPAVVAVEIPEAPVLPPLEFPELPGSNTEHVLKPQPCDQELITIKDEQVPLIIPKPHKLFGLISSVSIIEEKCKNCVEFNTLELKNEIQTNVQELPFILPNIDIASDSKKNTKTIVLLPTFSELPVVSVPKLPLDLIIMEKSKEKSQFVYPTACAHNIIAERIIPNIILSEAGPKNLKLLSVPVALTFPVK